MFRRAGIVSMLVLTVFLCGFDGTQSCNNTRIGPSGGEVAAAAIGVGAVLVGTVVLIEVHHSHHTIKGCAFMGPNGLEIQDSGNQKQYLLTGVTPDVKAGDLVRVHGSRVKKDKGSTADQAFLVEKMNKDYGVCKVPVTTTPGSKASAM